VLNQLRPSRREQTAKNRRYLARLTKTIHKTRSRYGDNRPPVDPRLRMGTGSRVVRGAQRWLDCKSLLEADCEPACGFKDASACRITRDDYKRPSHESSRRLRAPEPRHPISVRKPTAARTPPPPAARANVSVRPQ